MSDQFYIKLPLKEKNDYQIGQIFWVPAPLFAETTFSLRIDNWKAGEDITQAHLQIRKVATSALGKLEEVERVDMNRMVIPEIALDSSEDLVVSKVKRRPAVLLSKDCYNMRNYARYETISGAKKCGPNALVFAPIYSMCKEESLYQDYPELFIQKVKEDKYPYILFMPSYSSLMKNDSMLILSKLFSVAFHSAEATKYCIDPICFGSKIDDWNTYIMGQSEALSDIITPATTSLK
jgi:hypothetical protein